MSVKEKVMEAVKYHGIAKNVSEEMPIEGPNGCGLDQLDFIELIMQLEEKFDIEISDDEMKPIVTVKELQTLVDRKVEEERR